MSDNTDKKPAPATNPLDFCVGVEEGSDLVTILMEIRLKPAPAMALAKAIIDNVEQVQRAKTIIVAPPPGIKKPH